MDCKSFLDEVKGFQSSNLKKVSTQVTRQDGKKYIENLRTNDISAVSDGSRSIGYVLDMSTDVTVALITRGLMLGSQDVAMELDILRDCNITHVLNVGYDIPNYFESTFVYKNVNILDLPSTNIRLFFEGCFDFIDDGRQEGCVLVHCNAGVSRAPTIVIAYLMNRNRMRFKEAYDLVKNVRPCIQPNEGFTRALKEYDKELFGS